MEIRQSPFENPNGLTVRELKQILSSLPEENENGEEFEVWLDVGDGLSSPVKSVCALNRREDGCDILLGVD